MPYVIRDSEGNIIAISSMKTTVMNEKLDDNHPDIVKYIKDHIGVFSVYGDSDSYMARRKIEYPRVGTALDSLMKTLKFLRDSGIDIGPDGNEWVDSCIAVKDKIPKDWKPE